MLASNKKRYGVSFFGSFLFHSFSLFFSVPPPPPTLRLEYRNVLYTHILRIGLRHIMSNQLTCKHPT